MSSETYEVEQILDCKIRAEDSTIVYYIKWKGYGMDDCTWEPAGHLDSSLYDQMRQAEAKMQQKIGELSSTAVIEESPISSGRKKVPSSPVQIEDSDSDPADEDMARGSKAKQSNPPDLVTSKNKPISSNIAVPAPTSVLAPRSAVGNPPMSIMGHTGLVRQAPKAPLYQRGVPKRASPSVYGPTRVIQQPRLSQPSHLANCAATPTARTGPYFPARIPVSATPNSVQWALMNRYGFVTGQPIEASRIQSENRADSLRVEHIGRAPARGSPGLWVLLKDDSNDRQIYVPMEQARKDYAEQLCDYFIPRVKVSTVSGPVANPGPRKS